MKNWCKSCRCRVERVAVTGTSDYRCAKCGELVERHFELGEPQDDSATDQKATHAQPSKAGGQAALPRASRRPSDNKPGDKSADGSQPQWRFDAGHPVGGLRDKQSSPTSGKTGAAGGCGNSQSNGGRPAEGNAESVEAFELARRLSVAARTHFSLLESDLASPRAYQPLTVGTFGILLLLMGQALMIWAFFEGHFVAWTVGNLGFVTGVFMTLWNHSTNLWRLQSDLVATRDYSQKLRQAVKHLYQATSGTGLAAEPLPESDPRIVFKSKSARGKRRPAAE